MTAASGASSVSGSPLPKWQLALAVGAPVALGLGYMYYKKTIKPSSKSARTKSKNAVKENGTPGEKQISIDGDCDPKNTSQSQSTPAQIAQKYKDEGNNLFKNGKYDEAIAHYNCAIKACPQDNADELATFYQNRAAAYEQLNKYSAVKADCTKALELKPRYAKALMRRARALEHCNDLEAALEDVTAACFLFSFSNQQALLMADRVLKKLGRQHAQEHLATKKLIMPSSHFIKNYISSFHKDPVFNRLLEQDDTDIPLGYKKIIKCLKEQKYDDIIPLCTEEIDRLDPEILPFKMELLLLRATFYLLLGKHSNALEDFEVIINSNSAAKEIKVNALVKRAVVYMQQEVSEKSFCDFAQAAELDPNCDDIYHHRGQVNLLMEKIDDTKADFEKAVELNPDFGVAYVQKCYADYRYALSKENVELIQKVFKSFETALEKFPDCPECYILYAQLLSETGKYQEADNLYAKAIEIDPVNATVYVHRGLLQLQWYNNLEKAIEYINKAVKIDEKCEFGYETLGSIQVQRGKFKEAIELFDKSLALGRTYMELAHIFSLRDAAKAQLTVRDKLGIDAGWNIP